MKRFFILLPLFLLLCAPSIAHARVDQRCFIKEQCIQARKSFNLPTDELEEGFYRTQETIEACGDKDGKGRELGFCLPVGKAKTQVQFGSTNEFQDVGDFIQKMYRYGIGAGIFLAAAMLIVAGLRWTASGGNPNSVGNAQKQIAGALVGLFLLVFSYFILNTINPYLVNMRLPQIWMINTIGLAPVYCSETNNALAFAVTPEEKQKVGYDTVSIEAIKDSKFTPGKIFDVDKSEAMCNYDYFVDGTGGAVCRGQVCPNPNEELCFTPYGGSHDECGKGTVAGKIEHSGLIEGAIQQLQKNDPSLIGGALVSALGTVALEGWEWPWVDDTSPGFGLDDDLELWAACGDGSINEIANAKVELDQNRLVQYYVIEETREEIILQGNAKCSNSGGLLGYVLAAELNEEGDATDETHFIGHVGTIGIDLGDDRAFRNMLEFKTETFLKALFSEEEIKTGLVINIDAAAIEDIDGADDGATNRRTAKYLEYGFCSELDRLNNDWWKNAGEIISVKYRCKYKPVTE
ncbi:hypothetical protein H6758_01785 [Candidatus Nomurabacteria bacterium]|nr:hypothetical protein [Candidatus Nomurabacteria bacterium]